MTAYGSDKPDLRNPIRAVDVTEIFRESGFRGVRESGGRRQRRARNCCARCGREIAQFLRQDGRGGTGARAGGRRVSGAGGAGEGADCEIPVRRQARRAGGGHRRQGRATRSFSCRKRPARSAGRWMGCARISGASSTSSSRTPTSSAGLPTFRSTSAIRKRDRWPSVTTRFRCRRGASTRSTRRIRCRSRRTNTTSSATASSCRAARFETIGPTSCCARSRLRGTARKKSKSASAAC